MNRPNIILITMDECKASALGCYGNKNSYTPFLNTFAKDSVVFTNSFTPFPKCVPSRVAMLTGRYPHTEGHRTLPGFAIRKNENNLPWVLRQNGYYTGLINKDEHTFERDYLEDCFDYYTLGALGLEVPMARSSSETDDTLFRAFYRGDMDSSAPLADKKVTQLANEFIKSKKDKPFYLQINYNSPHPPYFNLEPYTKMIRENNIELPNIETLENAPDVLKTYRTIYNLEHMPEERWRKIIKAYYVMLAFVDAQIGEVLQTIKKEKLLNNTIIIITSDHGDFAGEHGCVEKWDTLFYDCLVKVPLMIRHPKFNPFYTDAMVENIDLAPTILDILGLNKPESIQGESFIDVLNEIKQNHKTYVYSEGGVEPKALQNVLHYNSTEHKKRHPNYFWKQKILADHPFTLAKAKMIRSKNWKLVYRISGDKELYNLIDDPQELTNIAHKEPKIVNHLMEKLLQWSIKTETDYPPINTMYS